MNQSIEEWNAVEQIFAAQCNGSFFELYLSTDACKKDVFCISL